MLKPIKDYPRYVINEQGQIFNLYEYKSDKLAEKPRELKHVYDKSCGYTIVTLVHGSTKNGTKKRQNKRVHRLLMEAFVPNPNNLPQINHKDGNKLNNSLDNLEWCTGKHNAQHAYEMGFYTQIERAKKPIMQMDEEFNDLQWYESTYSASRATGIPQQNINKVLKGYRPRAGGFRWKYVDKV